MSNLIKESYNLIIYVGIDIPKLSRFAISISSKSELLIKPPKIDYDVFYLLLSKLVPLNQNSIIIVLESSAYYGDNLVGFLITNDFKAYYQSLIDFVHAKQ